MGPKEDTRAEEAKPIGDKKYGRLVRMLREGYLSLCIYKNVHTNKTFFDIVVYRKIKRPGKKPPFEYVRGANLKPSDLPSLRVLIAEAEEFLASCAS